MYESIWTKTGKAFVPNASEAIGKSLWKAPHRYLKPIGKTPDRRVTMAPRSPPTLGKFTPYPCCLVNPGAFIPGLFSRSTYLKEGENKHDKNVHVREEQHERENSPQINPCTSFATHLKPLKGSGERVHVYVRRLIGSLGIFPRFTFALSPFLSPLSTLIRFRWNGAYKSILLPNYSSNHPVLIKAKIESPGSLTEGAIHSPFSPARLFAIIQSFCSTPHRSARSLGAFTILSSFLFRSCSLSFLFLWESNSWLWITNTT